MGNTYQKQGYQIFSVEWVSYINHFHYKFTNNYLIFNNFYSLYYRREKIKKVTKENLFFLTLGLTFKYKQNNGRKFI